MKKSSFFLLTTILSFYSNISAAETTKWLQANLISDVGSKGGEKYVFSSSLTTVPLASTVCCTSPVTASTTSTFGTIHPDYNTLCI